MAKRRIPVGRVTAFVAIVVALWIAVQGGTGPHWKTLRSGVEFALIRGEPYCRSGSSQIALLRLDPAKVRISVRHYTRETERRPFSIVEWQQRSGGLAVFNAGQYYPDYSYMGLLVSRGDVISSRPHPDYKAALVASPVNGPPRARVLDLTRESIDPVTSEWREVAQSLMLFDDDGKLRIRKSSQVANRTVVAEDEQGRLLVITSEGGYTLHEFATLLESAPLKLAHAMNMDGGYEAELLVHSGGFRYASFGRWRDDQPPDAPGAHVPLPAVIVVSAP
jgi:hypothetical protein